jgi:hypothetical protein
MLTKTFYSSKYKTSVYNICHTLSNFICIENISLDGTDCNLEPIHQKYIKTLILGHPV